MKKLSFMTVLAIIFLFTGCGKEELIDMQDNSETQRILKGGSKGTVIESVKGSGHLYWKRKDCWRTFTINAVKYDDGTVEGKYNLNDHGIYKAKAIILDFTIFEDNRVAFVAEVEKEDPVTSYTKYKRFVVYDNGEGKSKDVISLIYGCNLKEGVTIEDFYGRRFDWFRLFEIEAGNIQVHK